MNVNDFKQELAEAYENNINQSHKLSSQIIKRNQPTATPKRSVSTSKLRSRSDVISTPSQHNCNNSNNQSNIDMEKIISIINEQSHTIENLKNNQNILRDHIQIIQNKSDIKHESNPSLSPLSTHEKEQLMTHIIDILRNDFNHTLQASFTQVMRKQDDFLTQWMTDNLTDKLISYSNNIDSLKKEVSKLKNDMLQLKGSRSVFEKVISDINSKRSNTHTHISSQHTKPPLSNTNINTTSITHTVNNNTNNNSSSTGKTDDPALTFLADLITDKVSNKLIETNQQNKKISRELQRTIKQCELLTVRLHHSIANTTNNNATTRTIRTTINNNAPTRNLDSLTIDSGTSNRYSSTISPTLQHLALSSPRQLYTSTSHLSSYQDDALEEREEEDEFNGMFSSIQSYKPQETYNVRLIEQFDDKLEAFSSDIRTQIDEICQVLEKLHDSDAKTKGKLKDMTRSLLSVERIRKTVDTIIDQQLQFNETIKAKDATPLPPPLPAVVSISAPLVTADTAAMQALVEQERVDIESLKAWRDEVDSKLDLIQASLHAHQGDEEPYDTSDRDQYIPLSDQRRGTKGQHEPERRASATSQTTTASTIRESIIAPSVLNDELTPAPFVPTEDVLKLLLKESIEKHYAMHLTTLEGKLSASLSSHTELDARLSDLTDRYTHVEGDVRDLTDRYTHVESDIRGLTDRCTHVEGDVRDLTDRYKHVEGDVRGLEDIVCTQMETLKALAEHVGMSDDREGYSEDEGEDEDDG